MVKTITSTQSLSSFVKGVCDIMRRSNCASALQYVPEEPFGWKRQELSGHFGDLPDQVLESIATYGRTIEQALDQLRVSLAQREGAA